MEDAKILISRAELASVLNDNIRLNQKVTELMQHLSLKEMQLRAHRKFPPQDTQGLALELEEAEKEVKGWYAK